MENIKDKIIDFIREEIGEFNFLITEDTLLEDDLGVTGGEAIELVSKIAKKYSIDITELDFSNYFHPEPTLFQKYKRVKPFTINTILKGIRDQKLV
jgi:acyl carrier protein